MYVTYNNNNNNKQFIPSITIISAVNQSIIEHRGEAEQSDDITILAFMYK